MPVKAKIEKFIYWTPRILSILLILFLAMFSLDVIEPGRSTGKIMIGMFMHNIPVFILTAFLIIAWKHELAGALTFIGAGLLYSGLTVSRMLDTEIFWYIGVSWILTIAGPAFLVGILFFLSRKLKRQK